MPDRVVVFLDAQNIYKGARDCFFSRTAPFTDGQVDPHALAQLLVGRRNTASELEQVRIYTGQPDASKQPKGYGASRKQYAAWRARRVEVVARPLRYPPDFPTSKPEEKGIDVQLAIDFITLALDDAYDAAILFSSDTDLVPALNFVIGRCPGKVLEVTAWEGRKRLSTARRKLWCHFVDGDDYKLVSDPTDYTR
jgi:uncharacterized LabA/DUF88 family protein